MQNSRVSAWLAAALLLVPVPRASGDTRYVWTDAAGDEHVTREPPHQGIAYSSITIPDAIEWRRRPEMPGAFPAKTRPSAQELFNQAAKSIYWLESVEGGQGSMDRTTHYGSAVAISEELALTNCHVTRGSAAELTIGTGKDDETGEAELEAADFDADRCVVRSRTLRLQPVKGIRPFDGLEIGETVYTIDAQGNLIGITSLSMRDSQGLNFAIPAEEFWK